MNLTFIDWSILTACFVCLGGIAVFTNKYTKSVADFLSANRCAGRYILGGAELLAMVSATMFVAKFEQFYQGGFGIIWWTNLVMVFGLAKSLAGWVQYRFRETRAMTMAQFFEMRYSRKFRVFTGMLAWSSGVLNFLIHPAVTSRLVVYFFGFPPTVEIFGLEIKTFIIVIIIMLSISVTLTLSGGQIALMVTDFFQSQIVLTVSLVVVAILLFQFDWSTIVSTLKTAPPGQSMLNPFDQSKVPAFNFWFFAMTGFFIFYQEMSFQGNQGYFSAAKSPHEAKMSKIISLWRAIPINLLYMIPAIIAFVVFNNPQFAPQMESINSALQQIADPQIQRQMTTPIMLTQFLPVGVMGLLATAFIACSISTDDTYLHAWGSIFIQDVVMPIRKKKFTPQQHIKWLRLSVILVAAIALIGGSLLPFQDYVFMYFQITFAIYAGGAGSAIIGGLYWKRGTAAGAWVAVINGAIICLTGFLLQNIWPHYPALLEIADPFPLNGVQITFISSISSIILYVLVSLLTCKTPINLDKILHRGKYDVNKEHHKEEKKIGWFRKLTGIDKEFTLTDKIIAILASSWILFWAVIVVFGSLYGLFFEIPERLWTKFWWFFILAHVFVAVITSAWFLIGGLKDAVELFRNLAVMQRDETDDGSVTESQNDN